ncbi:MAG TPA: hypothetical protein EYH50_00040 [Pyrodictium delaneyi]|uniref:Uncharacterized protein n=1 Tax=Pyrodictium delaneyi TaxID=1273541 RepID=A0A832ZVB6_9CREN|nr:hypothetical protein [Pyrodictium delaneyi]
MSTTPLVDIVRLIETGVEEARKAVEAGRFHVKVYALPRPRLRIRSPKKKIIDVDEGRIARLEYALIRSLLAAKSRNSKPTFKEFAELAGDYKAAAAYIAALWRSGLVEFDDSTKAVDIYSAAMSLSQKGYERRIARALDATFTLKAEKLAELPADQLLCVQKEGRIYCRYTVTNTARSQAKAQVKAFNDTIAS